MNRILVALGPLALVAPWDLRAQVPMDADHVLAAFVYRLPQFVEWPPSAVAERDSVELCVSTPDPFGSTLDEIVQGEELAGRPLALRRVADARSVQACHVLFVSLATERPEILLEQVRELPVLTIGEAPDFLRKGGMVRLAVVGGRVRFEINREAAERAGLRLSSQLLDLAITVRGTLR